jgi:type II secretory pathway component GspD/PulD (secretin)
MKIFLGLFLLANTALAQVLVRDAGGDYVFNKKTYKASELLHDYATLEGLNLVLSTDFKDVSLNIEGPRKMAKDAMANYVSIVLYQVDGSVVRTADTKFLNVIHARDNRYMTLPVFSEIEKVPKDYNHVQFSHQLQHIKAAELTWNLRPFMSRYGRIIDDNYSNSIHITDMGVNVHRLMAIVKFMDTQAFVKRLEEVEAINKKNEQVIKSEKSLVDIINGNQGLFLLVFLIIGSIIGFGLRGYTMKRIEGGW